MKHVKEFKSFKNTNEGIFESLDLSDIQRNLDELTFDARWNGERFTYKVYVKDYIFKENGDLKLYLDVEKNNQIGSNIMIVVGDQMKYIFMYHKNGESIDAEILPTTKSWLLAIRERLPKK